MAGRSRAHHEQVYDPEHEGTSHALSCASHLVKSQVRLENGFLFFQNVLCDASANIPTQPVGSDIDVVMEPSEA